MQSLTRIKFIIRLVKSSIYTTDVEGKLQYEMESNKVSFAYVAGLYSSIKDSDVN
jgi:peptidyl-prolyl cis-trans isomerase D